MQHVIQKFSAGGIVYNERKVLAIKVLSENEVVFPKGTIESGETPEETAVREVFEETGYQTRVKAPLGLAKYEFDEDGKHFAKTVHHFLLELVDKDSEPTPNREEYEDFENIWLDIAEAKATLTHEESKRILSIATEHLNR